MPNKNQRLYFVRFVFVFFALCCSNMTLQAANVYKDPGIYPNREYISHHDFEQIDPFNGALNLHFIDMHIPGNGGMDIDIVRSYNSKRLDGLNNLGYGWTLHFGKIYMPCSPQGYFELPDGTRKTFHLLSAYGNTTIYLSKDRWKMTCSNSTVAVTDTKGVNYQYALNDAPYYGNYMDAPASSNMFVLVKKTDLNNNWIQYDYIPGKIPNKITASDGRVVNIKPYYNGQNTLIASITHGAQAVSYTYDTPPSLAAICADTSGDGGYGQINSSGCLSALKEVSYNGIAQQKNTYLLVGNYINTGGLNSFVLKSITTPAFGTINYSYTDYTSNSFLYAYNPGLFNLGVVVNSKTSSDGGSWSFAYAPSTALGQLDSTIVSSAQNTITYKHHGTTTVTNGSAWKVGLMSSKTIGSQIETYAWGTQQISTQAYYGGVYGASVYDGVTYAPMLTNKTIVRDSATYTSTYSNHDIYGNPATITEAGPNGGNRITAKTYYNDPAKWIIGLPKDDRLAER
jgi:hypothetical protein